MTFDCKTCQSENELDNGVLNQQIVFSPISSNSCQNEKLHSVAQNDHLTFYFCTVFRFVVFLTHYLVGTAPLLMNIC